MVVVGVSFMVTIMDISVLKVMLIAVILSHNHKYDRGYSSENDHGIIISTYGYFRE